MASDISDDGIQLASLDAALEPYVAEGVGAIAKYVAKPSREFQKQFLENPSALGAPHRQLLF